MSMNNIKFLICPNVYLHVYVKRIFIYRQGLMQDKIIVRHTYFGEHMDVNC